MSMAPLRSTLLAAALLATGAAALFEDSVSLLQHTVSFAAKRLNTSVTPLTYFRDGVVRRPTPPTGYIPQPEIQTMKLKSSQTPQMQALLCGSLLARLDLTPSLQEPYYIQGAHRQAIMAMTTFSNSPEVQITCSNLLAQMVQWNWVLARAIADEGALDVMVAAMHNFPDIEEVRRLSGPLGSFCDFDVQNKQKLGELGLVEQVYSATDRHYTTEDVAQMYNLWSTLCSLPNLAEQMVEGNSELERGVRAMKTFRSSTVRGEVIMVHSACFMAKPAWRQRMVTAGIIPEILSAMRDEMSGVEGELDTVGKARLLFNGMSWLNGLAGVGPEARTDMLDAGVVDIIVDAMRNGNAEEHSFAEMRHDVRGTACGTLAAIMVDGPRQLDPLVRAREELTELPEACTDLLRAAA
eukprot:CAMPEP_0171064384 /NCGR_PEP_ID=MMETSP0766_2-20121228/6250_1 /TAXON_ID=439317 /ORGANISM="Gambierdiscus australes, Strain CAWD 149" /LENGTH=408 /DNA_ID=CAMNT_0011520413 /DNA_START=58 /DNA_END=1284 /DNA_ORIENTATION=-